LNWLLRERYQRAPSASPHPSGIHDNRHEPGWLLRSTSKLRQVLVGRDQCILYSVFRIVGVFQLSIGLPVKPWQFVRFELLEIFDVRVSACQVQTLGVLFLSPT
jgi:hypothetical protein